MKGILQTDAQSHEDWMTDEGGREANARSIKAIYQTRCDCCGRFLVESAPGVSWSQSYAYDFDGTPDLHDATFRCSPCTDKHGIKPTNCKESVSKYHGRNIGA